MPAWCNYRGLFAVAAQISVLRFVEATQKELDRDGIYMAEAIHAETYMDLQ